MERSSNSGINARWILIRLALVVFDIFAVNISYFSALYIRYYVASEFNAWAVRYITAFTRFAPFYTVCSLLVFYMFKLYNSRWKYAGWNDLTRICAACLATCVIQIVGSTVLVMRMPTTYYFIGACIQFVFITLSRFSYRFMLVERDRVRKRRNKTAINVMIVGVGETSRIVLKHLEGNADNAAHPVCLMDYRGNEFGNMIEGIPVLSGLDKIAPAITKYGVETVILADPMIPQVAKKQIRDICQDIDVDVQDFAGYLQDFRGAVSLRSLLEYTQGPVELVINGSHYTFEDGEQAILSLNGKYVISRISAKNSKLVIELQKDILVPNDVKEDWVQNYKMETGEDISFF